MSWNVVKQLPRLGALAGLALVMFTATASAASYKGQFTLSSPVQWGEVVLQPGTYQFSLQSDSFPYQVLVRGNGAQALFLATQDELTPSQKASIRDAELNVETINGRPVVTSLAIAKLGKELTFGVPKDLKSFTAATAPTGNGACAGKL